MPSQCCGITACLLYLCLLDICCERVNLGDNRTAIDIGLWSISYLGNGLNQADVFSLSLFNRLRTDNCLSV